jgi:hypothetical protein
LLALRACECIRPFWGVGAGTASKPLSDSASSQSLHRVFPANPASAGE